MQPKIKICLAAILLAFVAGCAAVTPGSGSHQRDLTCPADLDVYCGSWTVYATNIDDPADHIMQGDEFVIGKKSNGRDPLAIFPRPALHGRWDLSSEEPENKEPKNQVALREIKSGNQHRCMVGRVRMKTSDSHPSDTDPSHEWHSLTLRSEIKTRPEIGEEETIRICLEPQTGGGWPDQCTPVSVCEHPDDDDPRSHGGRAHAQ